VGGRKNTNQQQPSASLHAAVNAFQECQSAQITAYPQPLNNPLSKFNLVRLFIYFYFKIIALIVATVYGEQYALLAALLRPASGPHTESYRPLRRMG